MDLTRRDAAGTCVYFTRSGHTSAKLRVLCGRHRCLALVRNANRDRRHRRRGSRLRRSASSGGFTSKTRQLVRRRNALEYSIQLIHLFAPGLDANQRLIPIPAHSRTTSQGRSNYQCDHFLCLASRRNSSSGNPLHQRNSLTHSYNYRGTFRGCTNLYRSTATGTLQRVLNRTSLRL
jgi:hypothetical protein